MGPVWKGSKGSIPAAQRSIRPDGLPVLPHETVRDLAQPSPHSPYPVRLRMSATCVAAHVPPGAVGMPARSGVGDLPQARALCSHRKDDRQNVRRELIWRSRKCIGFGQSLSLRLPISVGQKKGCCATRSFWACAKTSRRARFGATCPAPKCSWFASVGGWLTPFVSSRRRAYLKPAARVIVPAPRATRPLAAGEATPARVC